MRPRLLDLFCGAGGAGMGYHRAGFDVTGVDIEPQPRYPFRFVQGDALLILASRAVVAQLGPFDAIHASPPCQAYSVAARYTGREYPDLLGSVRELLNATGLPWVIENVRDAPMRADYRLCGCMFGLRIDRGLLARERWFETSWHGFDMRSKCYHDKSAISVVGHGTPTWVRDTTGHVSVADRRLLMDTPWMNREEMSQAIPPAYTEYIGRQLMEHLERAS